MRAKPFLLLLCAVPWVWADPLITREYRLKHADATPVIQTIKFMIPDATGNRIMGGQGQKLVVTDTLDRQVEIAELLPIIDQKGKETLPMRVQMEMTGWAANYLQQKKKSIEVAAKSNPAAASRSPNDTGAVKTYDIRHSSQAYKSVYSDEDAKLSTKPRVVRDDPVLISLAALELKGIVRENRKTPLALLFYGGTNYTAHDGGLFAANRDQLKGVVSEVKKDSVILTGPDRIPREIKFKSSL